jgi:hypothetical protein
MTGPVKFDTWYLPTYNDHLQLDDIPCGTSKSSTPGIKKEELLQLQGTVVLDFCWLCSWQLQHELM